VSAAKRHGRGLQLIDTGGFALGVGSKRICVGDGHACAYPRAGLDSGFALEKGVLASGTGVLM